MKIESYKNVKEFNSLIYNLDDLEKLNCAKESLNIAMEINNLKEKLESMEQKLTEGKLAMFYFFTSSLDSQEVVFALEKVSSRIKMLEKKNNEE